MGLKANISENRIYMKGVIALLLSALLTATSQVFVALKQR